MRLLVFDLLTMKTVYTTFLFSLRKFASVYTGFILHRLSEFSRMGCQLPDHSIEIMYCLICLSKFLPSKHIPYFLYSCNNRLHA